MKKPFRIYISDPHAIFREGIRKVISGTADMTIAGESESVFNLMEDMRETKPDLLLIYTIPFKASFDVIESISTEFPDIQIVLLTNVTKHPDLRKALNKSISGIIYKAISEDELLNAFEELKNGNPYYSPEVIQYLNFKKPFRTNSDKDYNELWTDREIFILKCICKGIDNQEISELLNLSNRTIEGYRSRMIVKAGVPNTVNLVLYAIKNKLIATKDL